MVGPALRPSVRLCLCAFMLLSDVIVAVASPPGSSLRGIVRISGAQTFDLCRNLLSISEAASAKSHDAADSARRTIGQERAGAARQAPCFSRGIRRTQFHLS